ncbi:hypothetical protein P153DRAFT_391410 [Dothidotthia symphoricarpi CBS 119687]|uniref:Uncharacterized protein n=1 Tax=Dothidotthia symphoricarpi CBS 119687 TaxID=1392245 RepID=A0A6A5ZXE5_9PLEO|nr:uncharacterized protein P153DRAFT_391410 [Dothidotthia symphoricarpi CBS 119687]KAF2123573.1 hypothetical protein P153DRAFT_391410 [Dothidotthia symphoricarpi CBS 119687]
MSEALTGTGINTPLWTMYMIDLHLAAAPSSSVTSDIPRTWTPSLCIERRVKPFHCNYKPFHRKYKPHHPSIHNVQHRARSLNFNTANMSRLQALDYRRIRNLTAARKNLNMARKEVYRGLKLQHSQLSTRNEKFDEAKRDLAHVMARIRTLFQDYDSNDRDLAKKLDCIVADITFINTIQLSWGKHFQNQPGYSRPDTVPDIAPVLAPFLGRWQEAVGLHGEYNRAWDDLATTGQDVDESEFTMDSFRECLIARVEGEDSDGDATESVDTDGEVAQGEDSDVEDMNLEDGDETDVEDVVGGGMELDGEIVNDEDLDGNFARESPNPAPAARRESYPSGAYNVSNRFYARQEQDTDYDAEQPVRCKKAPLVIHSNTNSDESNREVLISQFRTSATTATATQL